MPDSIYLTPEHQLLRDQTQRFIAAEVGCMGVTAITRDARLLAFGDGAAEVMPEQAAKRL